MTNEAAGVEGRILKLGLIGSFLAGVTAIGSGATRRPDVGVVDLVLAGIASYRIGRMVAFEGVAAPVREPFTTTVPDDTGVDDTVVARGTGIRWTIGELLSCPTCVGTWSALALYAGLAIIPGPTRVLINVLAIAGIAEVAGFGAERLEWSARAARRASA